MLQRLHRGHIICHTFGGSPEWYELSWVKLCSPFINTRVKSSVLPNPNADLIVGNVEGVKEVNGTVLEEWKKENNCLDFLSNAVTSSNKNERVNDQGEQLETTPSTTQTQLTFSVLNVQTT